MRKCDFKNRDGSCNSEQSWYCQGAGSIHPLNLKFLLFDMFFQAALADAGGHRGDKDVILALITLDGFFLLWTVQGLLLSEWGKIVLVCWEGRNVYVCAF